MLWRFSPPVVPVALVVLSMRGEVVRIPRTGNLYGGVWGYIGNNWVLGMPVLGIVAQALGEYMIVGYLDPWMSWQPSRHLELSGQLKQTPRQFCVQHHAKEKKSVPQNM